MVVGDGGLHVTGVPTRVLSWAELAVASRDGGRLPEGMEAGPLRTELMALAARDGVPVRDVLVADASRRTRAVNAYVSGLGPTRRIVVYDTLLREAPHQ